MPKLNDFYATEEVLLPKSHIVVNIATNLSFGDVLHISNIQDDVARGLETVRVMIRNWNLVDDEDKPLDITSEVIAMLPASDATILMNKATEIMQGSGSEKKADSSTTSQ